MPNDDMLLHLIRGWQGLVKLIYDLSSRGAVLPEDVLAYSEKMHRVLGEVIVWQRELRREADRRSREQA